MEERSDDVVAGGKPPRRFWVLLVLFATAYLWRITGVAPFDPITDHLSNVALSGAATTVLSGPRAFDDPSRRPRALAIASAFVALNVVGEMVLAVGDVDALINRALGGINTSDPVDGAFGIVAVALVVACLPWNAGEPRGPTAG